jgi:hypothetical protein
MSLLNYFKIIHQSVIKQIIISGRWINFPENKSIKRTYFPATVIFSVAALIQTHWRGDKKD